MNMLTAMLVLWSGISILSVAAAGLVVWLNIQIDTREPQVATAAVAMAPATSEARMHSARQPGLGELRISLP